MKRNLLTVGLLALCTVTRADTLVSSAPTLTLSGARAVIAAGQKAASDLRAPGGAIAVVDVGGNVVAVERLDRTFGASATVSIGKARTAARFNKPTRLLEETINSGRTAMVALPDFTPLQGGVPIVWKGELIGAVGVSGAANAQQDDQIAQAAANAIGAGGETK